MILCILTLLICNILNTFYYKNRYYENEKCTYDSVKQYIASEIIRNMSWVGSCSEKRQLCIHIVLFNYIKSDYCIFNLNIYKHYNCPVWWYNANKQYIRTLFKLYNILCIIHSVLCVVYNTFHITCSFKDGEKCARYYFQIVLIRGGNPYYIH